SAPSTVTAASCSRLRPRNGPPEAVSTTESTCSGSRPSRHWYSAECSLSTGSRSPPPARCAAVASAPPATRLSLFASASVTPRSSAHSVARMPAKPTIALSTTSGSDASSRAVGSPPTWTCATPRGAASSSSGVPPDISAQSSSRGCASTISIACRPIEPVAPSRAIRLTSLSVRAVRTASVAPRRRTSPLRVPERQHDRVRRRAGEQERVEAVEQAAVASEQAARVLHGEVALDGRLEQVSEHRRDRDRGAEHDRLPDREVRPAVVVEGEERDRDRGGH